VCVFVCVRVGVCPQGDAVAGNNVSKVPFLET
jgi:hypothetical protein